MDSAEDPWQELDSIPDDDDDAFTVGKNEDTRGTSTTIIISYYVNSLFLHIMYSMRTTLLISSQCIHDGVTAMFLQCVHV